MKTSERSLSRQECVELLGGSRPAWVGLLSVDGARPVALACFLSPGGEVVIPTGVDRELVGAAAGRPVTIEFEQSDRDSGQRWAVRGTGRARPLGQHERPPVESGTALDMVYAFENGIRVKLKQLSGQPVTRAHRGRLTRR